VDVGAWPGSSVHVEVPPIRVRVRFRVRIMDSENNMMADIWVQDMMLACLLHFKIIQDMMLACLLHFKIIQDNSRYDACMPPSFQDNSR